MNKVDGAMPDSVRADRYPAGLEQTPSTILSNLNAACDAAVKELRETVNRSAGQHKRVLREAVEEMVKHVA